MIATILHSSPKFNAVFYNEKKVSLGCAALLECKNMGSIDSLGYSSPKELQEYLLSYSSQNSRVKNAQFHVAISCKGKEWTEEELLDFGHRYLAEMGYGDPQQPLLIYAHRDTDNNHIHIVTSRVAPNGRKINDSKERVRSQKVLEKLLKQNLKKKAEQDIKDAMEYRFMDMRQLKTVFEAMGYQCFEKRGPKEDGFTDLYIKKSGQILATVKKEDIKAAVEVNVLQPNTEEEEKKIRRKLWSILTKFRDFNSDVKGLERDLRRIGIGVVWMGPKDKPFAYQLVDFDTKEIYNGNKILYISKLLDFKTSEQHLNEIKKEMDRLMQENPYITTKELNAGLRQTRGFVKKGCLYFNKEKELLDEEIKNVLKRNDTIDWWNGFNIASEDEREVICKLSKMEEHPEFFKIIPPIPDGSYKKEQVAELYSLLSTQYEDASQKRQAFYDAGYNVINHNNKIYITNVRQRVILDMSKTDMPVVLYSDLRRPHKEPQGGHNMIDTMHHRHGTPPSKKGRGLSIRPDGHKRGQNREWEVGKKGYDKDDPDRNNGLNY